MKWYKTPVQQPQAFAATDERNIFGDKRLSFGPANVFWDTAGGGANLFLGESESVVISVQMAKIDLRTSQQGDRAADKAVSSQMTTVTVNLAQPDLVTLDQVLQGFVREFLINDPTGYAMTSVIGERDSDVAKQLSVFLVDAGVETTDLFEIIDVFEAAPSTETADLNYNATDQRFFPVEFLSYLSSVVNARTGANEYWSSRASA